MDNGCHGTGVELVRFLPQKGTYPQSVSHTVYQSISRILPYKDSVEYGDGSGSVFSVDSTCYVRYVSFRVEIYIHTFHNKLKWTIPYDYQHID